MGEAQKRLRAERSRFWLALPMAAGLALFLWAVVGLLRLTITAQAPGATAGGAATLEERCGRGMPADLAAACLEDSRSREAAARWRFGVGAVLGLALFGLALGVGRSRRRPSSEERGAA